MEYRKLFYVVTLTLLCTILSKTLAVRTNSKDSEYEETNYAKHSSLSTPEECARECRDDEDPKVCYYHFTLELYTVLGGACEICKPNSTNNLSSDCQCIEADGIERGSILTANRMLPGPSIQVCEGDRVVVDVKNTMQGLEVTIHWHGIYQRGTQYYDGVPFITQCPIHQGNTFRYQWGTENNAGTHFWHAHTGLQKLDGLSGSIIVRQSPSRELHYDLYDYDLPNHVLFISDWIHESSLETFPGRLHTKTGQQPDTVLINGKGQFQDPTTGYVANTSIESFTITQEKRYRFRMINSFASVCPMEITIEGHDLIIIATDGQPVVPSVVDTIISFSGDRYDFVIDAHEPIGAYWIHVRGLGECTKKKVQQHAILRYDEGPYNPDSPKPGYDTGLPKGVVLNPLDEDCNQELVDAICVSSLESEERTDSGIIQERPDVKIYLPFRFFYYNNLEQLFKPNTYNNYMVAFTGKHLIFLIDEISFVFPSSPPLSQINDIDPEEFCNGDNRPYGCGEHCTCTHKIDIPLNAVVEIVLIDEGKGSDLHHPFHLHGYAFNVIGMGKLPDLNSTNIYDFDRRGFLHRNFELPPKKDTIAVPNGGYVILRFRADNPGYWLFHCHFLDHLHVGMNVLLHVGTENDLPPVPQGFPTCGDFLLPIL